MDPVPAITITPGPPPKAASKAIALSPTISASPGTISDNILRMVSAVSELTTPAIPAQVETISLGFTLATMHACRMAAARDSFACDSPARTKLLPPAEPLPSTEFSSPIRHEVLLPPPSFTTDCRRHGHDLLTRADHVDTSAAR